MGSDDAEGAESLHRAPCAVTCTYMNVRQNQRSFCRCLNAHRSHVGSPYPFCLLAQISLTSFLVTVQQISLAIL